MKTVPPEQKATPISVAENTSRSAFHRPVPRPPGQVACVRACMRRVEGQQAALGKSHGSILWASDSHIEGILTYHGRVKDLIREMKRALGFPGEVGKSWPNSTSTCVAVAKTVWGC